MTTDETPKKTPRQDRVEREADDPKSDLKQPSTEEYGRECIKVLEGLKPVRKRPDHFIAGE